jgi:hypothetical protein
MIHTKDFFCYECNEQITDVNEKNYLKQYDNDKVRDEIMINDVWSIIDDYVKNSYTCEICKFIKENNNHNLKHVEIYTDHNANSYRSIDTIMFEFYKLNNNNILINNIKCLKLTEENIYKLLKKMNLIIHHKRDECIRNDVMQLVAYGRSDMILSGLSHLPKYPMFRKNGYYDSNDHFSKKTIKKNNREYFKSLGQKKF